MSIASAIAIYFIIWWLCLFVVLPFGVRNAHESGREGGRRPRARARPSIRMLWRKVLINTTALGRGLRGWSMGS